MNTINQNQPKQAQPKQDAKPENSHRTLAFQDAALLISLVLIAGFVRFGTVNEQDTKDFSGIRSTSELVNNTDTFIGKTVTIRSKPVQQIGLSSFTVNDQPRIIQQPLLVVNASGVPFNLPANRSTKVEVTGQVRNLVISQIERDFNLSLQEEDYRGYINRPAIIAKSIKLVD